jgi:predicted ATPase
MISQLHFRNFKCHRDTDLKLRPLTCFVGPNGAGKSSVLQMLGLIGGNFPSRLGREHATWARVAGTDSNHGGYDFELPDQALGHDLHAKPLKLRPEAISKPSLPEALPPTMSESGSGLASVIANLILSDSDRFNSLTDSIRLVIPDIRGLRVKLVKVGNQASGHQLLFDMVGKSGLPASEVSDGTLIVTALLTALYADRTELFLLDDLEQGLHPAAQRELVRVLRALVQSRSDLQILFTTHSPYIVDELAPDEVIVLALDETGHTVARSLADHPDAQRALSILTTGEFLAAEGENWILAKADVEQT